MRISVVIPAYNEAKCIKSVIESIPQEIDSHPINTIVVDDGSHDETAVLAQSCGALVISHMINRGQGAALKTGIDYALRGGTDIVVTFDADGQHAATEIRAIVEPIVNGRVQVVLGSRFLSQKPRDIPLARLIVLRGGILLTRVISNIQVTDTHNGFRAFHANVLRKITLVQDKMEHASEILDQISVLRIPYIEIPVTISYTEYSLQKGQNSLNAVKIAFKMFLYKLKK